MEIEERTGNKRCLPLHATSKEFAGNAGSGGRLHAPPFPCSTRFCDSSAVKRKESPVRKSTVARSRARTSSGDVALSVLLLASICVPPMKSVAESSERVIVCRCENTRVV